MPKKRSVEQSPSDPPLDSAEEPLEDPSSELHADESPEVQSAAEAVRRAKVELGKAQDVYEEVRREAVSRLQDVREAKVGEVVDGVLSFVRKHPGPGVILACLSGFFLGRLFRR